MKGKLMRNLRKNLIEDSTNKLIQVGQLEGNMNNQIGFIARVVYVQQ